LKTVLFCQNPYAFGILEPIKEVLKEKGFEYLWFVNAPILEKFPFKNDPFTSNMNDVKEFGISPTSMNLSYNKNKDLMKSVSISGKHTLLLEKEAIWMEDKPEKVKYVVKKYCF